MSGINFLDPYNINCPSDSLWHRETYLKAPSSYLITVRLYASSGQLDAKYHLADRLSIALSYLWISSLYFVHFPRFSYFVNPVHKSYYLELTYSSSYSQLIIDSLTWQMQLLVHLFRVQTNLNQIWVVRLILELCCMQVVWWLLISLRPWPTIQQHGSTCTFERVHFLCHFRMLETSFPSFLSHSLLEWPDPGSYPIALTCRPISLSSFYPDIRRFGFSFFISTSETSYYLPYVYISYHYIFSSQSFLCRLRVSTSIPMLFSFTYLPYYSYSYLLTIGYGPQWRCLNWSVNKWDIRPWNIIQTTSLLDNHAITYHTLWRTEVQRR